MIDMNSTPASTWQVDVLAGRGYTEGDSWSNAGFVDVVAPKTWYVHGLAWSPVFSLGVIGATKQFGRAFDKTTWFVGGGANIVVWRGLFARFELGAVSSQTPAFSSTYQFSSAVGWQWDRFSVAIRHISNGGLRGDNYGETMALAGVSF